ncbi:hypothetical protein M0R45_026983 [Rubus argutus]|uniref:Maturase K n=1 Tax=Rubus argutus TaxID=59490 RepID=A0AAW1X0H6_RUBAR
MEILSLDTYFHASHLTTLGPLVIKLFINPQTLCAILFTTLKTRYEVYIRPLLGFSSFLQTHHELTLSQENLCFIIQEYGKHSPIDQAVFSIELPRPLIACNPWKYTTLCSSRFAKLSSFTELMPW